MGKGKHRQDAAGKASAREASTHIQYPDQMQADSMPQGPAAATALRTEVSHEQARDYLTYEQMVDMKPSSKLALDVSHLLNRECRIFTTVNTVLNTIHSCTQLGEVWGRQVLIEKHKPLLKELKQEDPEELFYNMNSGTDMDLKKWQHFSVDCLESMIKQHQLYGTPLRVWLDDDVLAPGKRAARERARINGSCLTENASRRSGVPMSRALQDPAPTLTELGDDDVTHLDLRERSGIPRIVPVLTRHLREGYNLWYVVAAHKTAEDPMWCCMVEASYHKRLHDVRSNAIPDRIIANSTCLELAVMARALYNMPIPVQRAYKPDAPDECSKDSISVSIHTTATTAEMMQPIVIPADVCSKGGYIVAGDFRQGHGMETVHLKFADLKLEDDIMLHLRHESDPLMPIARMNNTQYITILTDNKRAVAKDKAANERALDKLYESSHWHDSSSFQDQLTIQDPAAKARLRDLLFDRLDIGALHQALYGTPTRLYYTSDNQLHADDVEVQAYLQNVRELCCKKLQGIDNVL